MMPRQKERAEAGFTPVELPIALFCLGVLGVLAALLVHYFARPLPWYAWPLAFVSVPVLAVLVTLFCFWRHERRHPWSPDLPERLRKRREEKAKR